MGNIGGEDDGFDRFDLPCMSGGDAGQMDSVGIQM